MLRKTVLMVSLPLMMHATTIGTLLNTLEKRPEYRLDMLNIEKSGLGKKAAADKLMPKVELYGGYETYNSPNGLLPIAPNEMTAMVKDQHIAQPFSKHIFREGINVTWPLFVKSVYTLKEKASLLHLAAKEKQRLDLIQREAVVVGSVAQLRYLEALQQALRAKKRSIMQTKNTTEIKVKAGRVPQSTLYVLNSHVNNLDINLNDLAQNINLLQSKIETLTGIHLTHAVPLRLKHAVRKGEILALKPLHRKVQASRKGVQAAEEAYLPSVVSKGSYALSQADAYNNGKSLHEGFGSAGIFVSMPLFDASKHTASQQAKVAYLEQKTLFEQTEHTLKVQAQQLQREIALLKRSVALAKKSVAEQQRLLEIAKVSLGNGSITEEEYLRYEDALADAKAGLYKAKAQLWQDRAQLAVIYGNDLRRIVK